jgi:hypothetical protein
VSSGDAQQTVQKIGLECQRRKDAKDLHWERVSKMHLSLGRRCHHPRTAVGIGLQIQMLSEGLGTWLSGRELAWYAKAPSLIPSSEKKKNAVRGCENKYHCLRYSSLDSRS